MRKNSILFFSIVSIALLSGCAKERDNFDKYLTDGTWTMSSIDEQSIEVETYDYVLPGVPTKTSTSQQTTTYADGKTTTVRYNQTTNVPGGTTFTRETKVGTVTLTFKFNKDGTYEQASATKSQSSQNDTELGNGPVVNVAEAERTNSRKGYWYWVNTTETKQQLSFDGQTFDVSINKNSFSMALNVSGAGTSSGTDGTGEYVKTSESNQGVTYHFSK